MDAECLRVVETCRGRQIERVSIHENDGPYTEPDALLIEFMDGGPSLRLRNRQECCECLYMTCDDDLSGLRGECFQSVEVSDETNPGSEAEAETENCDDGQHDIQFLTIRTDKSTCVVSSHNEHNGYYGGFDLVAELF